MISLLTSPEDDSLDKAYQEIDRKARSDPDGYAEEKKLRERRRRD